MLHDWDGFLLIISLTLFPLYIVMDIHVLSYSYQKISSKTWLIHPQLNTVSSISLTSSFDVILGFIWTFWAKIHSFLGVNVCLLLKWCSVFVIPRLLFLLQLFGDCSQGKTGLVKVHSCFWGLTWVAWTFPWYQGEKNTLSCKYSQRCTLSSQLIMPEASKSHCIIFWNLADCFKRQGTYGM